MNGHLDPRVWETIDWLIVHGAGLPEADSAELSPEYWELLGVALDPVAAAIAARAAVARPCAMCGDDETMAAAATLTLGTDLYGGKRRWLDVCTTHYAALMAVARATWAGQVNDAHVAERWATLEGDDRPA